MLKKLVSFICCCAPMAAGAAEVQITSPYDGDLVVSAANDIIITDSPSGLSVSGAITTVGKLWVGSDRDTSAFAGDIYTGSIISASYSVTAGGNITIDNGINIVSGKTLLIGGENAPINLNLGPVEVAGAINVINASNITMTQFIASGIGTTSAINGSRLTVSGTSGFQLNNSANLSVDLGNGIFSVSNGAIENNSTGVMDIHAGVVTTKNLINGSNNGTLIMNLNSLNVTGGDSSTAASIINKGDFFVVVNGATTLAHGFDLGTMNVTNVFSLTTGTLSLGDRFDTFYTNDLNSFTLNVTNGNIDTNGNMIINGATNSNATMNLTASGNNVLASGIQNLANLNIDANNITIANDIVNDSGVMNLTAGGIISAQNVMSNDGVINVNGEFSLLDSLYAAGGLYQNGTASTNGSVQFRANDYELSAASVNVNNISQTGAAALFNLYTNDLTVGAGGIDVQNFTIQNLDAANGMNAVIGGNVSGGASFIGIESMAIGGNYTFNDSSRLLAIANAESSGYNYWATASFDDGLSIVNNSSSAEPIITVSGNLILDVTNFDTNFVTGPLTGGQFGISLHQSVDETSAIWLMRVDGAGGVDMYSDFIKRLAINFCNDTGTLCVDTLDPDLLPVFLVAYDTDNNGSEESIYVVFENPMKIFLLQPVVDTVPGHTQGEHASAGALDDLIGAQLTVNGFTYDSPLKVVGQIFTDTPLSRVDEELLARMADYTRHHDATVIQNFARLFQLREANQIANSLALDTHTLFRDMSDRFVDEAIWNRNRWLNKLWMNADYALVTNDFVDIDGDATRFSLSLGYDWQSSETLILGWFGHLSHTNSAVDDNINLGYGAHRNIRGRVETDVDSLGFGAGAYFLKTLDNKMRLYGDAMFNINMIDVERNQTWVDTIKGDTTSFGIVSEFGLIHDLLNQYVIGNVYARVGYNFGFDMTEKVGDVDYMNLDFDGYFMLTPGYSLTAQKRIYPSAWFELRPYATVGLEYDLLGTPDTMKYKFALAHSWTDYDIGVDPLWANAGVGVEFLSVSGWHVGLGYRYQYNADMQMHKLHVSAKYRF